MRPNSSSAAWLQGGARTPNPLLDPHLVSVSRAWSQAATGIVACVSQMSLSDGTRMFTSRNSLPGPPSRNALGPKFFCAEEKCRPWNGLSSIVPLQTQEDGFPLDWGADN